MSHQPKQNDTPNVIGLMNRSAEMDKDLPGQKELQIEKNKTTELLRF